MNVQELNRVEALRAKIRKGNLAGRIFVLAAFSTLGALVLGMLYHRPLDPAAWMALLVCVGTLWFTLSTWREDMRPEEEDAGGYHGGAQPATGGAG